VSRGSNLQLSETRRHIRDGDDFVSPFFAAEEAVFKSWDAMHKKSCLFRLSAGASVRVGMGDSDAGAECSDGRKRKHDRVLR
jgi:hypothetical protein